MDIKVNKAVKSIQPFSIKDIPDLLVLTGENGTGKTQLIEYLYGCSSTDNNGIYRGTSEMNAIQQDVLKPESVVDENTGSPRFSYPSEVYIDGVRVTRAILRGVQAPSIDVGEQFNFSKMVNEAERIEYKHMFYRNHPEVISTTAEFNINTISDKYAESLGFRKGSRNSSDATYPTFTVDDLDIIKKIEEINPNADVAKDRFYYIALQQIPQNEVFAANIKFLYYQYWAKQNAGMSTGEAPWLVLNKMGEALDFKFELVEPKISENKFNVILRDRNRKVFVSPDSLSSGEKVIFSLFIAMYTTTIGAELPQLILFDEPDAYLHPSLCNKMLYVMQKVFIEDHNIKVIMTTLSPTTVALVPEKSIYQMVDGKMRKSTKRDAILSLTSDLNTISVYYENRKQIFVEADNDNLYLSHVFHHAMNANKLNKDIDLRFVNVGDKEDGGCTIVKSVVNQLVTAGNNTVYGIIDWDTKNNDTERIKVLGKSNRYAIDNYIVDPLSIAILYVELPTEKEKIGFTKDDSLVSFGKKTQSERQSLINAVIARIEPHVPISDKTDTKLCNYTTIDGNSYSLPKWFTTIRGHDLVPIVKKAVPFLNAYTDDKKLYKKIIDTCYGNYPEIIPMEIVETLHEIQLL